MKKGLKGLLTGLCLACALALTGCGVSQKDADKINEAVKANEPWTIEEVHDKYGTPTIDLVILSTVVEVYVNGCKTFEDVEARWDAGKKVEALVVTYLAGKTVSAVYDEDYTKEDKDNKK